ncbi:MAG TPA: site-specific integrase [Clostridia bacterium]|nr:site-specific integrase [Clostridia bacterium]
MVDILVDADRSPKTINTYTAIVKAVVASAFNDEGEEIHPRKWNHDFVDMTIVKKSNQNTPTFSSVVMTGLAAWKKLRERALFILCAATGLRIGEALGIEIDKHISPDFTTIYVRQKVRHGEVEQRLKTDNAYRDVDLHPLATKVLKDFVGKRKKGFLFCTKSGKPLNPSNVIRRHLHPALKQIGYINPHTGTFKAGNHAFRRFRNTYLRNHTGCPDGLCKYWLGHADQDMSDLYDKIKEDVEFRKKWAEQCGLGFELPSVVPNVPKNRKKSNAQQSE